MDITIFVPSKDRADITKTHTAQLVPDAKIVVHNDEQAGMYADAGIKNNIIVSNAEMSQYGKAHQMNWVLDNFVEEGQWVCFMDDDIKKITAVHPDYYDLSTFPAQMDSRKARDVYNDPVDYSRLTDIFDEMIILANSVGANYCGFASVDNYFFRTQKYSYVGFVIGVVSLLKKTSLRVPVRHKEDVYLTAESLKQDGIVLVNKYLHASSDHFKLGGHGTLAERFIVWRKEAKELCEDFGGLFRIKDSPTKPKNFDVAIRYNNVKQIAKWREDNGY